MPVIVCPRTHTLTHCSSTQPNNLSFKTNYAQTDQWRHSSSSSLLHVDMPPHLQQSYSQICNHCRQLCCSYHLLQYSFIQGCSPAQCVLKSPPTVDLTFAHLSLLSDSTVEVFSSLLESGHTLQVILWGICGNLYFCFEFFFCLHSN